jgi:hypothetical protein
MAGRLAPVQLAIGPNIICDRNTPRLVPLATFENTDTEQARHIQFQCKLHMLEGEESALAILSWSAIQRGNASAGGADSASGCLVRRLVDLFRLADLIKVFSKAR